MRQIHLQYPSHDDRFRRETPRNFVAKRREILPRNFFFFSLFFREIVNLPFAFFAFRRENCAFFLTLTVFDPIPSHSSMGEDRLLDVFGGFDSEGIIFRAHK